MKVEGEYKEDKGIYKVLFIWKGHRGRLDPMHVSKKSILHAKNSLTNQIINVRINTSSKSVI